VKVKDGSSATDLNFFFHPETSQFTVIEDKRYSFATGSSETHNCGDASEAIRFAVEAIGKSLDSASAQRVHAAVKTHRPGD